MIGSWAKQVWNKYKDTVKQNCGMSGSGTKDLSYYRNSLFAVSVVYFLPFSLIALVPGVYMSFVSDLKLLGILDMLAAVVYILLVFHPSLGIHLRKLLFIGAGYLLAVILLYFLGQFGPGFIYLLALTIFAIIILPSTYAYLSVILNTIICFGFAILLHFGTYEGPLSQNQSAGSWIAVSSNLVFLSAVFSFLIPKLFQGLQNTITEQNVLKDELKRKNKELEQFAFVASHDLQEPLRMITSFLTQLDKKYAGALDDRAKKYIYFSVDGATRMREIILNLLEFSRVGKIEGRKEMIDINKFIEEILTLYRKLIREKKALIFKHNLPTIMGYRQPLAQIFQNLIGNALKYSQEQTRPEIVIACKEHETYWEFSVRDNGIGIDPEYFDKIFVIFQRLHSKDEFSGTGIGLAIVKKIVDYMGGEVWVTSEAGKGSTFYFTVKK